jgi:hypothetical protein
MRVADEEERRPWYVQVVGGGKESSLGDARTREEIPSII